MGGTANLPRPVGGRDEVLDLVNRALDPAEQIATMSKTIGGFGLRGKVGDAPSPQGQSGAFQRVSRIAPILFGRRRAQPGKHDGSMLAKELQHLALDLCITERIAPKAFEIDRISA